MNYLIAVLADRIEAEEAAVALEKAGIPQSQVTILGRGYKSADEFGLIDPFLIPFGFAGGYLFNLITGLHTFDWAGEPGNHIVGGIAGAIGGAMGSIFVGGGVGLSSGSGDALPYRNRLGAGKYIIIVQGSENLKNQATLILRQFNPENLQGYALEQ
ncbi:MAG: hypothetical protein LW716_02450 [Microcystis sp. 53602_E8]|nr:hypothetical protein [Microcystis sp. 53602_E8]